MVKINRYILLLLFILLPLLKIFSHNEFLKIDGGVLTPFQFDVGNPNNDWDDITTWETTQSTSIPYYLKSWALSQNSGTIPNELDPTLTKTQLDRTGRFVPYNYFLNPL